MGKTLKRSYIPMDWITINEEWWQRVFSIEAMGILKLTNPESIKSCIT